MSQQKNNLDLVCFLGKKDETAIINKKQFEAQNKRQAKFIKDAVKLKTRMTFPDA